jgi:serine protease Do
MRCIPACSTLRIHGVPFRLLIAFSGSLLLVAHWPAMASELRRSPIVKAIDSAKNSVVNIHGQKTVNAAEDPNERSDLPRRVNGMGTGVVIDERGYILTNYHVVEGVRKIEVTLADESTVIAQLISNDAANDLAIIKVTLSHKLPVISIGTSKDLMIGEQVIALGNAYGYSHTATRGIISALHRSVQVSDAQSYEDLIQTDASINPGNSGGPLLNIDGEMIGINVAVRAGAQGIGFAIPVDKALSIAAELMSVSRLENRWHGVVARPIDGLGAGLVVGSIEKNSPAERAGLRAGDVIKRLDGKEIERALDFERALFGQNSDAEFELAVERNREPIRLSMQIAPRPRGAVAEPTDEIWNVLGLRLAAMPPQQFKNYNSKYRGGLAVTAIRPGSPAARQGVLRGDVLVGMHDRETVTIENVEWILNHIESADIEPLRFYILRASDKGSEVLYGHMAVSGQRAAR